MGYEIGELAEKFEVGNRGPGFISDGDKWDPGGDSYGSYQLATKVGTLQGYLKTSLPYTDRLKVHTIKSKEFNKVWQQIAKENPEQFKQSQFDYVKTISYEPCRNYADKLGIINSFALNSALFSISNQHGGWKKILIAAQINKTDTEEQQIKKLYAARKDYIKSLSSLSAKIKDNLIKQRCEQELIDCLRLQGSSQLNDRHDISTSVAPTYESLLERIYRALKAYLVKSPK